MKKSIVLAILFVMVAGVALTACSTGSSKKSIEGKYVSSQGYLQMNKDSTFIVGSEMKNGLNNGMNNAMNLTGKYNLNGKNIIFNVEKMNGEEVGSVASGTIEGDVIIGPDKLQYTKE